MMIRNDKYGTVCLSVSDFVDRWNIFESIHSLISQVSLTECHEILIRVPIFTSI